MALQAGTRLGHYEVLSSLGAGGMGEVYRARDTKLGREVAVKLLLEDVSADPERIGRFEREARVLASLNHPNVATLHGFEKADETSFLVMELVEGQTLADRIARGPIPVEEALPLFLQIAEGLEAAHEKGVIHRDLKPANVKVSDEGLVKVLDFGLAKEMAPMERASNGPGVSVSPTLTVAATRRGEILGTAAYMSPEQAAGKAVDKRTDVWAFGCCLFESLVGKCAFEAESAQQTLAKVLEREPEWEELPASIPPLLSRLLRRCLNKDARQRIRDMGDVRLELSDDLGPTSSAAAPLDEPRRVRRLSITLPDSMHLQPSSTYGVREGGFALSPDGTLLVYVARLRNENMLVKRSLDELDCEVLEGTDGAWSPFFSPDGQQVGFFDAKRMLLKRVSIRGGRPRTLCLAEYGRRGVWGENGWIFFSGLIPGLARVPEAGDSEPEEIDLPEKFEFKQLVALLNGDDILLLNLGDTMTPRRLYALSLKSGKLEFLRDNAPLARYVPTGHLLSCRRGALVALRFDATSLTVVEPPVTVTEERDAALRGHEFSADGTVVHARSRSRSEGRSRIVWVDRHGEEEVLDFPPPTVTSVIQISPDGSRAVWGLINKSGEYDLWTHDLTRGTSTRVTFHPSVNTFGIWTPDGKRLAFCSQRDGVQNLYWKSSSGAGQAERLTTSEYAQVPFSISSDGETLLFAERGRLGTGWQMWMLPLEGEDRAPTKIQESRYNQTWPTLSPDGRWLVYVSDESGREEVYVQPFPAIDEKSQISRDGGVAPVWGSDGRELFYMSRGAVMAAKIETEPMFQPGVPAKLFENPDYDISMVDWLNFVVSKDGERFLLCKSDEALREPLAELVVVENWFEELKRLVPTD